VAEDNEHIRSLIAARDRAIEDRRDVAKVLGEKYQRGHTENMREVFEKIQSSIEAIERAIGHEKMLAGPVIPS
jgi:hypothetical protein